jgi:hypothetical protein
LRKKSVVDEGNLSMKVYNSLHCDFSHVFRLVPISYYSLLL